MKRTKEQAIMTLENLKSELEQEVLNGKRPFAEWLYDRFDVWEDLDICELKGEEGEVFITDTARIAASWYEDPENDDIPTDVVVMELTDDMEKSLLQDVYEWDDEWIQFWCDGNKEFGTIIG